MPVGRIYVHGSRHAWVCWNTMIRYPLDLFFALFVPTIWIKEKKGGGETMTRQWQVNDNDIFTAGTWMHSLTDCCHWSYQTVIHQNDDCSIDHVSVFRCFSLPSKFVPFLPLCCCISNDHGLVWNICSCRFVLHLHWWGRRGCECCRCCCCCCCFLWKAKVRDVKN